MRDEKYTIDCFEEEFAVLLVKGNEIEQVIVMKEQLPSDVYQGDILELKFAENGKDIKEVIVLKDETNTAKEKAENLLQKLFNKNKYKSEVEPHFFSFN